MRMIMQNKSMFPYCPSCNVSLKGAALKMGESAAFGGITHFSRVLNAEILRNNEHLLMWQCPDCGFEWVRASEGKSNPGVFKAKPIVAEWRL
jgi:predicted RNA-binding Zn-ribbon protein involved in translation (DUF1610 family)